MFLLITDRPNQISFLLFKLIKLLGSSRLTNYNRIFTIIFNFNFFILTRQLYIHFTIHSIHQLNGKLLCYFIRVFWYPGRLCNYVKHWAGITSYDFFWHEAMFLVNSWYIDGRVPYNYYFYFLFFLDLAFLLHLSFFQLIFLKISL